MDGGQSKIRAVSLAVALVMGTVALPVQGHEGEQPALSMQTLRPGPHADDGWLGRSPTVPQPGQWHTLALVHYARSPLRFSAQSYKQTVLGDLGMAEIGAVVGLPNEWAVGAVLPTAFQMRGGGPNLVQLSEQPAAPALGDVRLEGRKGLWQGKAGDGDAAAAAALVWELPTSSAQNWIGGAHALTIQGIIGAKWGQWQATVGGGTRLTPTAELTIHAVNSNGSLDHNRTQTALRGGSTADVWAAAGSEWLDGRLQVRGELRAAFSLVTSVPQGLTVVDTMASGQWQFAKWLRAVVAVGGSPSSGAGSAGMRVLAGLRFLPDEMPADRDLDGIDDKVDRCADKAEDLDGFEDGDGCPDVDDDGDGVADVVDKCRLTAEDRDGFEDGDGCPDLDDDGDGVPDKRDLCPRKAEDKDGRDDDDGCPDPDDDGDGIDDKDDLCPHQPERKNGFEDSDGCPDFAPGEAPEPIGLPAAPTPAAAIPVAPLVEPTPVAPAAKSGKGKVGAKAAEPPTKKPDSDVPAPTDGKPRAKVKPIAP